MVELVRDQPGLFLSEIREKTYDQQRTLLSLQAIHHNLVNQLSITLKKADTVNIKKCLVAKYSWVEKMLNVPAEFLVFTGMSSHVSLNPSLMSDSCIPFQMRVQSVIASSFGLLPDLNAGLLPNDLLSGRTQNASVYYQQLESMDRWHCQSEQIPTMPRSSNTS